MIARGMTLRRPVAEYGSLYRKTKRIQCISFAATLRFGSAIFLAQHRTTFRSRSRTTLTRRWMVAANANAKLRPGNAWCERTLECDQVNVVSFLKPLRDACPFQSRYLAQSIIAEPQCCLLAPRMQRSSKSSGNRHRSRSQC